MQHSKMYAFTTYHHSSGVATLVPGEGNGQYGVISTYIQPSGCLEATVPLDSLSLKGGRNSFLLEIRGLALI